MMEEDHTKKTLWKIAFHGSASSFYLTLFVVFMTTNYVVFIERMITTWYLILHIGFIFFRLLQDFINLTRKRDSKFNKILSKIINLLFIALIFPFAMYIPFVYWLLFYYNRNLIHPTFLVVSLPSWVSTSAHTVISVVAFFEIILTKYNYEGNILSSLTLLIIFGGTYASCLIGTYLQYGFWLYPLFHLFSTDFLPFVFFLLATLLICMFFLGFMITQTVHDIKSSGTRNSREEKTVSNLKEIEDDNNTEVDIKGRSILSQLCQKTPIRKLISAGNFFTNKTLNRRKSISKLESPFTEINESTTTNSPVVFCDRADLYKISNSFPKKSVENIYENFVTLKKERISTSSSGSESTQTGGTASTGFILKEEALEPEGNESNPAYQKFFDRILDDNEKRRSKKKEYHSSKSRSHFPLDDWRTANLMKSKKGSQRMRPSKEEKCSRNQMTDEESDYSNTSSNISDRESLNQIEIFKYNTSSADSGKENVFQKRTKAMAKLLKKRFSKKNSKLSNAEITEIKKRLNFDKKSLKTNDQLKNSLFDNLHIQWELIPGITSENKDETRKKKKIELILSEEEIPSKQSGRKKYERKIKKYNENVSTSDESDLETQLYLFKKLLKQGKIMMNVNSSSNSNNKHFKRQRRRSKTNEKKRSSSFKSKESSDSEKEKNSATETYETFKPKKKEACGPCNKGSLSDDSFVPSKLNTEVKTLTIEEEKKNSDDKLPKEKKLKLREELYRKLLKKIESHKLAKKKRTRFIEENKKTKKFKNCEFDETKKQSKGLLGRLSRRKKGGTFLKLCREIEISEKSPSITENLDTTDTIGTMSGQQSAIASENQYNHDESENSQDCAQPGPSGINFKHVDSGSIDNAIIDSRDAYEESEVTKSLHSPQIAVREWDLRQNEDMSNEISATELTSSSVHMENEETRTFSSRKKYSSRKGDESKNLIKNQAHDSMGTDYEVKRINKSQLNEKSVGGRKLRNNRKANTSRAPSDTFDSDENVSNPSSSQTDNDFVQKLENLKHLKRLLEMNQKIERNNGKFDKRRHFRNLLEVLSEKDVETDADRKTSKKTSERQAPHKQSKPYTDSELEIKKLTKPDEERLKFVTVVKSEGKHKKNNSKTFHTPSKQRKLSETESPSELGRKKRKKRHRKSEKLGKLELITSNYPTLRAKKRKSDKSKIKKRKKIAEITQTSNSETDSDSEISESKTNKRNKFEKNEDKRKTLKKKPTPTSSETDAKVRIAKHPKITPNIIDLMNDDAQNNAKRLIQTLTNSESDEMKKCDFCSKIESQTDNSKDKRDVKKFDSSTMTAKDALEQKSILLDSSMCYKDIQTQTYPPKNEILDTSWDSKPLEDEVRDAGILKYTKLWVFKPPQNKHNVQDMQQMVTLTDKNFSSGLEQSYKDQIKKFAPSSQHFPNLNDTYDKYQTLKYKDTDSFRKKSKKKPTYERLLRGRKITSSTPSSSDDPFKEENQRNDSPPDDVFYGEKKARKYREELEKIEAKAKKELKKIEPARAPQNENAAGRDNLYDERRYTETPRKKSISIKSDEIYRESANVYDHQPREWYSDVLAYQERRVKKEPTKAENCDGKSEGQKNYQRLQKKSKNSDTQWELQRENTENQKPIQGSGNGLCDDENLHKNYKYLKYSFQGGKECHHQSNDSEVCDEIFHRKHKSKKKSVNAYSVCAGSDDDNFKAKQDHHNKKNYHAHHYHSNDEINSKAIEIRNFRNDPFKTLEINSDTEWIIKMLNRSIKNLRKRDTVKKQSFQSDDEISRAHINIKLSFNENDQNKRRKKEKIKNEERKEEPIYSKNKNSIYEEHRKYSEMAETEFNEVKSHTNSTSDKKLTNEKSEVNQKSHKNPLREKRHCNDLEFKTNYRRKCSPVREMPTDESENESRQTKPYNNVDSRSSKNSSPKDRRTSNDSESDKKKICETPQHSEETQPKKEYKCPFKDLYYKNKLDNNDRETKGDESELKCKIERELIHTEEKEKNRDCSSLEGNREKTKDDAEGATKCPMNLRCVTPENQEKSSSDSSEMETKSNPRNDESYRKIRKSTSSELSLGSFENHSVKCSHEECQSQSTDDSANKRKSGRRIRWLDNIEIFQNGHDREKDVQDRNEFATIRKKNKCKRKNKEKDGSRSDGSSSLKKNTNLNSFGKILRIFTKESSPKKDSMKSKKKKVKFDDLITNKSFATFLCEDDTISFGRPESTRNSELVEELRQKQTKLKNKKEELSKKNCNYL